MEGKWTQENMGPLVGLQRREGVSDMQLASLQNLEQMLRDLIEEAEQWDLAPKPASLRWTGTYEEEDVPWIGGPCVYRVLFRW